MEKILNQPLSAIECWDTRGKVILSAKECSSIKSAIEERVQASGVIGVALSSQRGSELALSYPCIVACLTGSRPPFCIDPSQQAWPWIVDAIQTLSIGVILCGKDTSRAIRDNTSFEWLEEELWTSSESHLVALRRTVEPMRLPEDVAYVVQTSGTTGTRKTVLATCSSVLPNVEDFKSALNIDQSSKILSVSPPTFDPFYLDVLCSLTANAKLILCTTRLKSRPRDMLNMLEKTKATHVQMTPSLYKNLGGKLGESALKFIVLGGEKFPMLVSPEGKIRFFQAYGVTEMSVWQSLQEVKDSQQPEQAIWSQGNLLSKTDFSLSEDGEVLVKSESRGCYISNGQEFERCFEVATGDIAKRVNGEVFFMKRKGDTLKINGKRVSLPELEALYEDTLKCRTVCLHQNASIVAFVEEKKNSEALQRLPSYLRPKECIEIDTFPLTSHGKIDRKALAAMVVKKASIDVKSWWKEATGVNPRENSSFIEDGGDSFLAVQLAAKVEEACSRDWPKLVDVLLNATFADFLAEVERCVEGKKVEEETSTPAKRAKRERATVHAVKYSLRGRGELREQLPTEVQSLEVEWKSNLGKCIDASPLLVRYGQNEESVFIGSHSGRFACYDAHTGRQKWQASLANRIEGSASISEDGERVVLGCYDHFVYCFDAKSGDQLWRAKTGSIVKCTPMVKGNVYVGSYDHHLYCLNQKDGRMLWKENVSNASILATPAACGDSVLAATLDGTLASLNASDGRTEWRVSFGAPIFSSPVELEDDLVLATVKGRVLRLSCQNGSVVWEANLGVQVFSPVVHAEDLLLIGCSQGVFCLNDANGRKVRLLEHKSAVLAAPCVASNGILSLSSSGEAKFNDLQSGKERWTLNLPGKVEVYSSPVISSSGRVIFGRRDDNLYCCKVISKVNDDNDLMRNNK